MKTSKPTFLPCLLLACLFNFSFAADSVLDNGGAQAVRAGVNYYFLSAAGDGRGLIPAKGANGTCPFEVFQTLNNTGANTKGLPLRLSPVNSTDGTVHVGADVTVEFAPSDHASECPQSSAWVVKNFHVTTGGDVEGRREPSLFTIRRFKDAYALQYCPRSCKTLCPRLICQYIGIQEVEGRRRLAVKRQAFKIVFQKA